MTRFSFSHRPTVIGMVHFSALEGTDAFEGDKALVLARAREDLSRLQQGGVDAIMFENNFDTPKFATLPALPAAHFAELLEALVPETKLPWGLSPLWNDYHFGFTMCKKLGGVMVRVPVFVDSVETVYGKFMANAADVLQQRSDIGAEDVMILADVQVKHAKMIHPRPFEESVREAVDAGADGIIITGQWTGDPPSVEQCAAARRIAPAHVAILTGSGTTSDNLPEFAPHIDACIVGTAFKAGDVPLADRKGPNIVEAERRLDLAKISRFMEVAKTVQRT